MQAILDQIAEWLKGMLVDGIMNNLEGMFDAVNQQVSDVASQVGNTPQNFSPGIFSMIRNSSESVTFTDYIMMSIWGVMGYMVFLGFALFKTGSLARSVMSTH